MPDRKVYYCKPIDDAVRKPLYLFCDSPDCAANFEMQERAVLQVIAWNKAGINMPMQDGATQSWHDFQIEAWNGRVLIYCVGPFMLDYRPERSPRPEDNEAVLERQ